MLSKNEVFNIIEETLSNNLNESLDCALMADAIVERLDEEGLFEEQTPDEYYD